MRRQAVVPLHTVTWYLEGQHCVDARPGDLILVRHAGIAPLLIRTGQRMRYWWVRLWAFLRSDWATLEDFDASSCAVNHAMTVVEGGPAGLVEEQTFRGGRLSALDEYVAEAYCVVHVTEATDSQRWASVNAAVWAIDLAYGFVSIAGLALGALLGGLPLTLGWRTSLICSADACLNLRCQGLVPDRADLSTMPADLARWFDARLPKGTNA